MVGQAVCMERILYCQSKWRDIWDRCGTASPRFSHIQYFYSCPRRWNREDIQMAASREGTVRSLEDKIRIQNDLGKPVFLRSNRKTCTLETSLRIFPHMGNNWVYTAGWNNFLASSSAENHPEAVEDHKLNSNFVLLQKRVAPDWQCIKRITPCET